MHASRPALALLVALTGAAVLTLAGPAQAQREGDATAPAASVPLPGPVRKVEQTVQRNAKAAASAVESTVRKGAAAAASGARRGARAAASGVARGVQAAASGVQRGAAAAERGVRRGADAVAGVASSAAAKASVAIGR